MASIRHFTWDRGEMFLAMAVDLVALAPVFNGADPSASWPRIRIHGVRSLTPAGDWRG